MKCKNCNKEIDIIELLKRVKEGKAPKRIEIEEIEAEYNEDGDTIETLYFTENGVWFEELFINFDTKIKILDKPIIEELNYFVDNVDNIKNPTENEQWIINCIIENKLKINEIIRVINNKE